MQIERSEGGGGGGSEWTCMNERRQQSFQSGKGLSFILSFWDFPVMNFRLVALLCFVVSDQILCEEY